MFNKNKINDKLNKKNSTAIEFTRINEVMKKPRQVARMMSESSMSTDPNGSYTGVPEEKYEKPVQDADDL